MQRRGNPLALSAGMQTGASTLENNMEVPQKLKIELLYDPAIALLGIYSKDTKIQIREGTRSPMFTAALSTIAKVWKQPKCSLIDKWLKQ